MRVNFPCLLVLQVVCAVCAYGTDGNKGGYVYPSRNDRDTVVVFIHGFNGDPVGTWTNEKTGAYFPKLVADDKDINADVCVYAYESPVVGRHKKKLVPTIADELISTVESEMFAKGKRRLFL